MKLSTSICALYAVSIIVAGSSFHIPHDRPSRLLPFPVPNRFSVFGSHRQSTVRPYTADDSEKDRLAPTLQSMLRGSSLIYTYAQLRKIVNEHDPDYIADGTAKPEVLVNFVTPALIVTQKGAQKPSMDRYLKYPITAAAVRQFIEENRNFLEEDGVDIKLKDSFGQRTAAETEPLKVEGVLKELQDTFDADIHEFDDEFNSEELVYGIIINRSEKRMTVVFRGSVVEKDWQTNFNCSLTNLEQFKSDGEEIQVHSGYSNYLFGESIEGPSKFERISNILRGLKQEQNLEGYEMFVTGHSLGGALCILLSFGLAASPDMIEDFKYVTAITFAAPPVGDEGFQRAFQALEKQGRLRHIRVSNQGDGVPVAPFRIIPPFPLYKQTGVNLHAQEGKQMEMGYPNEKSTFSQLWDGSVPLLNLPKMHDLGVHKDRIFDNSDNEDILTKTIDEVYQETVKDSSN